MSLPGLLFHGTMLSDRARNDALAAGIARLVKPGDVVVDVGAGTGLLSMLAARAGARRVYALERGPMAEVAREIVRRNGMEQAVVVERTDSAAWEPPEPADVLLCETLGYAVLEEGFRRTMADARDRMLRPGGRLMPRTVEVVAAPVSTAERPIDAEYIRTVCGLDLEPVADLYREMHQRCHVPLDDELSRPRTVLTLDCATMSPYQPLRATAAFALEAGAAVQGFALWFEATLADGVKLSSRSPALTNHWGQVLLPLSRPLHVEPGGEVVLSLGIEDRRGFHIEWEAAPRAAGDATLTRIAS